MPQPLLFVKKTDTRPLSGSKKIGYTSTWLAHISPLSGSMATTVGLQNRRDLSTPNRFFTLVF